MKFVDAVRISTELVSSTWRKGKNEQGANAASQYNLTLGAMCVNEGIKAPDRRKLKPTEIDAIATALCSAVLDGLSQGGDFPASIFRDAKAELNKFN